MRTTDIVGLELKGYGIIVDPRFVDESEVKALFETKAKCKYCDDEATHRTLWADGRAQIKTCGKHRGMARRAVRKAGDKITEVTSLKELTEVEFAEACLPEEDEEKRTVITPGGRVGNNRTTGSSRNGRNWIESDKPGGKGTLPEYIRIVRNGLMKDGMTESRATALAVAAIKRWARGGGGVSAKVKAAAAKALAQWEAMKARAKGKKDENIDAESKDSQADGSYPITDVASLKKAIQAFGRSKDKEKTKRHIIRMARKLGHPELIPDNWKSREKKSGPGETPAQQDESHEVRPVLARITDLTGLHFEPELKGVRYVRTESGKRRFGQPIGTIIVADGKTPLKNIRVVGKVKGYESWTEVQNRSGKKYHVGQMDDGAWVVTDPDDSDNELHEADSEEAVLKKLDSASKGGPKNPVTVRKATASDKRRVQVGSERRNGVGNQGAARRAQGSKDPLVNWTDEEKRRRYKVSEPFKNGVGKVKDVDGNEYSVEFTGGVLATVTVTDDSDGKTIRTRAGSTTELVADRAKNRAQAIEESIKELRRKKRGKGDADLQDPIPGQHQNIAKGRDGKELWSGDFVSASANGKGAEWVVNSFNDDGTVNLERTNSRVTGHSNSYFKSKVDPKTLTMLRHQFKRPTGEKGKFGSTPKTENHPIMVALRKKTEEWRSRDAASKKSLHDRIALIATPEKG